MAELDQNGCPSEESAPGWIQEAGFEQMKQHHVEIVEEKIRLD